MVFGDGLGWDTFGPKIISDHIVIRRFLNVSDERLGNVHRSSQCTFSRRSPITFYERHWRTFRKRTFVDSAERSLCVCHYRSENVTRTFLNVTEKRLENGNLAESLCVIRTFASSVLWPVRLWALLANDLITFQYAWLTNFSFSHRFFNVLIFDLWSITYCAFVLVLVLCRNRMATLGFL